MSLSEQQAVGVKKILKVVDVAGWTLQGEAAIKNKDYEEAALMYSNALMGAKRLLRMATSDDAKLRVFQCQYDILTGLSLAYYHTGWFKVSLETAEVAVLSPIDDNKTEAYYRCAKASYRLGNFEECVKKAKQAYALSEIPDGRIQALLKKAEAKIERKNV